MGKTSDIDAIAVQIVEAAKIFAQRNPNPQYARDTRAVWWYVVPEAETVFASAVRNIVGLARGLLSESDTTTAIMSRGRSTGLTDLALAQPSLAEHEIERHLVELIAGLLEHATTTREIELFIEPLHVDGPVPQFFGVDLQEVTGQRLQELYDMPLAGPFFKSRSNRIALARTVVAGDETTAHLRAIQRVERCMNLLRGCGGDFMFSEGVFRFGLIDHADPMLSTIIGEHTSPQLRYSPSTIRFLCPFGKTQVAKVVGNLISGLSAEQLSRLKDATADDSQSTSQTKLALRIVAGLEVLGSASREELNSTKMLLLSSALESLVGGESDELSFRGVTAMLAERVTFLVSDTNLQARNTADKTVHRLYGIGSDVRHGRRPDISSEDASHLAGMVRRVALALLDRADEWADVADIDQWVRRQRYGP